MPDFASSATAQAVQGAALAGASGVAGASAAAGSVSAG